MKKVTAILLLISSLTFLGSWSLESDEFYLRIEKLIRNPRDSNTYVVIDEKLIVYESKIDKYGELIKTIILEKKINTDHYEKLIDFSNRLHQLDSEYTKGVLGGYSIKVNLVSDGKRKMINIESYELEEIVTLLDFINNLIPKYKR